MPSEFIQNAKQILRGKDHIADCREERPRCSVNGCSKPQKAKGWCVVHYERFRRHGDPLGGRTFSGDILTFLENTVFNFDGDECLIWPFSTNGHGYGHIWRDGKMRLVSRIVCEREHGSAPTPEHQAAHSCGKGHEGCVSRKHLEWKTQVENEADKLLHGTRNYGERNGCAKLTESDVLKIRASTMPGRELAKEYGITRGAVSMIKSRQRWAWLEEAA